jgi:predicted DCC family thiol-disulfide oxidoreductase YuxK
VPQSQSWNVYYDGLCPLCSREINHYRKLTNYNQLKFVDITQADFSAETEKLDPVKVHRLMHVKSPSGELYVGVDAFIAIWDLLPRYQFLGRMARNRLIRPFMNLGYNAFARIRPYLPRKNAADCEASPYCEKKEHS